MTNPGRREERTVSERGLRESAQRLIDKHKRYGIWRLPDEFRDIERALAAQVPAQEERPSGYLPGMTHGTGGNLIPAETQELERLRMVEAAARRFLEAAQLESMTKAPEYIKAKRTLRRVLREVSDG